MARLLSAMAIAPPSGFTLDAASVLDGLVFTDRDAAAGIQIYKDADFVVIGQGTLSLPMKVAIRRLRKERGLKIGLVRLKWFRPFPTDDVVQPAVEAEDIFRHTT